VTSYFINIKSCVAGVRVLFGYKYREQRHARRQNSTT